MNTPIGLRFAIAWALACALQGCTTVSSQRAATSAEGVAYMLPKALLPVTLSDRRGALELSIGEPVLTGDSARTYVLRRSGNVFSSDNITFSVDPKTGLLTAADVKSDDKTLPAVIELLKGAGRAEAADASVAEVIFRGLFDPGQDTEGVTRFNEQLNTAGRQHVERLAHDAACASDARDEGCVKLGKLRTLVAAAPFAVHVEGAPVSREVTADCTVGLCYRLNLPHVVTLSGPGTSNSAVFALPNHSRTFALPLERWAFVKTTHDVKFEDGVFKSVTTDRPSSALALAAAPVAAASAVLGAVAQVLQLKIDVSGKEKALADAKVAEINAKAALDKALLDRSKSKGGAEAALLGDASRSRGALLVIRVGTPRLVDAAADVKQSDTQAKELNSTGTPVPATPPIAGKTSPGSPGKP